MRRPPSLLPYLALGIGVLALSFSAMFVRWADAPGPVTGFYRLLISTVVLTPLFVRRQLRAAPASMRVLLFPAIAGLFTAFDFAFWNSSLAFTTAANATLLGNTAPLWVALGAWLIYKEHLGGRFWAGLGLVSFGLAAPWFGGAVAVCTLIGLLAHEHAYVQAGQSIPLA